MWVPLPSADGRMDTIIDLVGGLEVYLTPNRCGGPQDVHPGTVGMVVEYPALNPLIENRAFTYLDIL